MRHMLPHLENVPLWPVIAAPVFLVAFASFVYWTYRKKRKGIYNEIEQLPFEDGDIEDK